MATKRYILPRANRPAAMNKRPDWTRRPRFMLQTDTGEPVRVAYGAHVHRQYVGGSGYCWVTVVRVWHPQRGDTWAEAAESAAPGEEFGLILTPEQFECGTRRVEDLTAEERAVICLPREEAAEALTSDAGSERRVRFVRRTDGRVRFMRFRYDPERRAPFDAAAKGLLPVFDLDKRAARFVNLDGVLR